MRFSLRHPHDPSIEAHYGFDPILGFFVDVDLGGPQLAYDATQPDYDHQAPLLGALRFFVFLGFFTKDALEDALLHLERFGHGRPLRRIRRAVEAVSNMKAAADV